MKTHHHALGTMLLSLALPNLAAAQPAVLRDDPKRPVTEISHDLGVQPDQFRQCFAGVSPSPAGQNPSETRVHGNKAVLLACLQKANPAITNASLDAVMDRYRPGGHAAQEPTR